MTFAITVYVKCYDRLLDTINGISSCMFESQLKSIVEWIGLLFADWALLNYVA